MDVKVAALAALVAIVGAIPASAHVADDAAVAPQNCPPVDAVQPGKLSAQLDAVACIWGQRRLLIVGELHGSNESPGLVATLVRDATARHHAVRVGLEMPATEQTALQNYIRSQGSAADRSALLDTPFWRSRDGRSSTAMFRLIDSVRSLRAAGSDVDLFAMEPAYPDQASVEKLGGIRLIKETGMVGAINHALAANKMKPLVVTLMGNYHSRYPGQFSGAPQKSVTEQLAAARPVVLFPWARQQSAWNCQDGVCGVHTNNQSGPNVPKGVLPQLQLVRDMPNGPLIVRLWMSRFTASPPATLNSKS